MLYLFNRERMVSSYVKARIINFISIKTSVRQIHINTQKISDLSMTIFPETSS